MPHCSQNSTDSGKTTLFGGDPPRPQSKSLFRQPSNFLLSSDGFLKLSDFGTAYAPDSFFGPEVAKRIKSIREMNQVKEDKDRKDSESENIQQRRSTFVGTAW